MGIKVVTKCSLRRHHENVTAPCNEFRTKISRKEPANFKLSFKTVKQYIRVDEQTLPENCVIADV